MALTPQQAKAVLDEVGRLAASRASLEAILTTPLGFGLTGATPLQRALCRVADGLPLLELAEHPDVLDTLGRPPPRAPRSLFELDVLSGTRTAKSMLAAAIAIRATQTCDVSQLSPGEVPRVPIVSLRKDLADVIFGHVKGAVTQSPQLRSLLCGEPTADALALRHPSGRPIEIKVVAGAKSGGNAISRWLAGIIFDEYTRMVGADEGVVNYDEMRKAALSRMLPGSTVTSIGSPWAPFGPAFERAQQRWLRPTANHVFAWARADKMNPQWWTPERAEQLRVTDPDAYRTDFLAEFMEPEELFFPASLVDAACREEGRETIPRVRGQVYAAAMDPATRSNAWTLVVGTRVRRDDQTVRQIVYAHQWVPGTRPLDPLAVLAEMAPVLKGYGVNLVKTDQWSVDALRALASQVGLSVTQQDLSGRDHYERYKTVQSWFATGCLEIPRDRELVEDLKRVRKRVTGEGIKIVLPKTADGRHCDYAPAVIRLATSLLEDAEDLGPMPGDVAARVNWQMRKDEEAEEREHVRGRRRSAATWFEDEMPGRGRRGM